MLENIDANEQVIDDEGLYEEVETEAEGDEVTSENTDNEDFELPDKFKGKTAADIAKSFVELEKELGRKGNEVGELRRLTDEILSLKLDKTTPVKEEPVQGIDVDSLLENPQEVLSRAVTDNPDIKEIKDTLRKNALKEQEAAFNAKHPDAKQLVQNQAFIEWVQRIPSRWDRFVKANAEYDFATGDEIFSSYKEVMGNLAEAEATTAEADRKAALKGASTEKGANAVSKKKVYKRSQLIELKLRDPSKYAALLPDIKKAYAEGRVK